MRAKGEKGEGVRKEKIECIRARGREGGRGKPIRRKKDTKKRIQRRG